MREPTLACTPGPFVTRCRIIALMRYDCHSSLGTRSGTGIAGGRQQQSCVQGARDRSSKELMLVQAEIRWLSWA